MPERSYLHLAFALALGLSAYNFFRAITLDPGACPRPANDGELKAVCVVPTTSTIGLMRKWCR